MTNKWIIYIYIYIYVDCYIDIKLFWFNVLAYMKGKWQNHLCIKSNLEPAVSGKTSKNKISTTMWSTFLLLYCALK